MLAIIASSALMGAAIFYFGICIGEAERGPPAPAPASGFGEDVAQAIRKLSERQLAEISELRGAISKIEIAIDRVRVGEKEGDEARVAAPASTTTVPASSTSQFALPNLPIASEVDAQRLSALPLISTNTNSVDKCLESWAQESQLLVYLTIEDAVARFGRPSRAYVQGDAIMWQYKASVTREGVPGSFIIRVVRSRVVEAFAMP